MAIKASALGCQEGRFGGMLAEVLRVLRQPLLRGAEDLLAMRCA